MTRALVAYATKMGSTKEIAEAIGQELQRAGIDVTVRAAGDEGSIDGYDAVVVGSAVYAARWRSEAVDLLARLADGRADRRTWIFQSGPFEKIADAWGIYASEKGPAVGHRTRRAAGHHLWRTNRIGDGQRFHRPPNGRRTQRRRLPRLHRNSALGCGHRHRDGAATGPRGLSCSARAITASKAVAAPH